MARLPQPGADKGTWGDVLNDFLDQSHNADGTLKSSALPTLTDLGGITPAQVDSKIAAQATTDASQYASKSDIVVVTTGTGAADTAAIQAAITANPGKRIRIAGTATTLTATILIQNDSTELYFDAKATAGFTGGPMVRVLNASYCKVIAKFFDGNWQANVSGIQLMGALLGEFRLIGDRLPVGIDLDCSNAAATQNSALNTLSLTVRNGIKAFHFLGKAGQFASDNTIEHMAWWGASSTQSTGLDFEAYCDNNKVTNAYIVLTASGHIGAVYNSNTPASDMQVYENHFDGIIESDVAGTTAIKGNRTYQAVGQFPTYIRLRSSGSNTPANSIASNSDVVFVNSNLNGVPAGAPGENQLFIGAHEMKSIAGAPVEGNDWSCPIWTCQGNAISSLNFSKQIPPGWNQYKVTLWYAPSSGAGGNTNWTIDLAQLGVGYSINDGAATTVTGAAGTNTNTVVALDLMTNQPVAGAGMLWAKLTRNGTSGSDTATTVDARVVGVQLTRTL